MPFEKMVWTEFCRQLEFRAVRLAGEFANSWKDLSALTAAQRRSFAAVKDAEQPDARLDSFGVFFKEAATALLAGPIAAYNQKKPLQRSLAAIEEFESAVGDLLRLLPRVAELSGRDLLEYTGADHRSWVALWKSTRRSPKVVHLRDAVSDHLLRMLLARAALDGAFQLALARAALHLLVPWQTCRRAFLSSSGPSARGHVNFGPERQWWMETAERTEKRAAALLTRYDAWTGTVPAAITGALLRKARPAAPRKRTNWEKRHQKYLSFWSRQQRAVRAMLDLEIHLANLARATTAETATSLDALETEHKEVVEELDAAIEWLQASPADDASSSLPQPKARLLSSEERGAEWLRRVSGRVRAELPATIEILEPRQALPGWHKPWRELEPAAVFLGTLSVAGAPILLDGFREAEAIHRAVVREIERAREVVDFGFETARLEGGAAAQIAPEAVGNALSLLDYQKQNAHEIRSQAEAAAVHVCAIVLLESDIALEKSRIGLFARVTRRRGREAFLQLLSLSEKGLRTGSRRLWMDGRGIYRWALLNIGWIAPLRRPVEPVLRRPDLAETLEVQLHVRGLPMIYRRLFRLAPVEDPRFLVGREAEMAGFADALHRWDSGNGSSVIVIGARGSGKTSLINCAASSLFGGCEVIRGQFCERLLTPSAVSEYVRDLLQAPAETDIAGFLRERRRVVLIEEFERTFLRAVGGFDALRTLLDLMYSTNRSTLWVFSINETAFRYLDAVVGLGRHFSHQINAMSVRQTDLTNAILQRHGLSGLRLEFAPLPREDPRVSGLRRFFGLERNPQALFLDALYEQSEGIFRAAFELWQGSIERVEGGIVHMRQPLAPGYGSLSAEMTLEDCFALKAILQHGSLTAEELATVLATGRDESVRQLERLHLLDVLEPEPASPGVRVRPEAGRLVRETLTRRNLL